MLRAYKQSDFSAFANYFGSPRSLHTDGPVSKESAWDLFTAGAGRWVIAGHGAWTIERQSDQASIGLVSLNTAISLPEPELGWILWAGYEGAGFALEAAAKARDFAFNELKWGTLISGIHRDNARSVKLAERLGAKRAPDLKLEHEPETYFYRHAPT